MDDATLQLIKSYKTPESIIERLHDIHAVILTGITGAGKNTIISDMLANDRFERVVTSTTRAPRLENGKMEEHGVAYYFLTVDQAKDNIKNGEYIEVANVHGRINGSLIKEYERIADSGKIALTDVDYQGAQVFLGFDMANLLVLFIVPPSFDVWMERLISRGGGSLHAEKDELIARFRSAEKELDHALNDPRFIPVMNDFSAESATEIIRYATGGERPNQARIDEAHQVIRVLSASIADHIKQLENQN